LTRAKRAPVAAAMASAESASFRHRPRHLGDRDGHRRHRRGVHAPGREGDVAVILDEQRVDPALAKRPGILERGGEHLVHPAGPSRRAGEGAEMDHADDGLRRAGEREDAHRRPAARFRDRAADRRAVREDKHMAG
jgi:hypothetical protein